MKVNADGSVTNKTHIARVTPDEENCELSQVPNDEIRCAILANLFLSEGKPGKVSISISYLIVGSHKRPVSKSCLHVLVCLVSR